MKIDVKKQLINYDDSQRLEFETGPDEVFRFPAAAGTHSTVDAGTTKTTPGTVNAWVVININGTEHYIPAYTSKTT